MAGIIAAQENGLGLKGVAPQASLVAVKVLDAHGRGSLSTLINGLQWVYNHQLQEQIWLVNMSLGFVADSVPLQRAIQLLYERGTLMVAAAGNHCSDAPGQDEGGGDEGEGAAACDVSQTAVKYPARYPWVLAVTATDYDNQITDYSLTGSEVDVTAPGGVQEGARILSTALYGGYGYGSGTSQAAAHVTGALALMRQQAQLSLSEVQVRLLQTATDLGYLATQQGVGLIAVEPLLAVSQ
jgi:minor extracellular protease Epr